VKTNIQSSKTNQKKSFFRFNFLSELFFIVCIQVLLGLQPVYATTNNGLGYFGFAIVDCGWDDPSDSIVKTNYIDEVASFTNIAHMCVYSSSDKIGNRIATFNKAGVKAILHIESILFRPGLGVAPSGGKKMILRSNAATELTKFVTLNKDVLNPDTVAALYIIDEPVWNGVSLKDLTLALQIVKKALPDIPRMVIEASQVVNQIMIPIELDWVGIVDYGIIDPEYDEAWLAELNKVSTARSRADQKIVIVANTQWLPYFQSDAGINPSDMEATINSYARLAASYPDVVALVGYAWAGGLDDPQQLGARSLPSNVQQSFQTIGFDITGK
jgi:hypothetical protein